MEDMHQYWQVEFKVAWVVLCEKLYLPDGYNYGRDGRGLNNYYYDEDAREWVEIDMFTEMISLKQQIEWDTKHGIIMRKFKHYTIKIWNLLGDD